MDGVSERETCYTADADEAKRYGLTRGQRQIVVRWETIPGRETDDGGQRVVDEIIATGCRMEMMDESNCWMDVNGLRVWIRAMRIKGQREPRLVITATPESCHVTQPAPSRGAAGDGAP